MDLLWLIKDLVDNITTLRDLDSAVCVCFFLGAFQPEWGANCPGCCGGEGCITAGPKGTPLHHAHSGWTDHGCLLPEWHRSVSICLCNLIWTTYLIVTRGFSLSRSDSACDWCDSPRGSVVCSLKKKRERGLCPRLIWSKTFAVGVSSLGNWKQIILENVWLCTHKHTKQTQKS